METDLPIPGFCVIVVMVFFILNQLKHSIPSEQIRFLFFLHDPGKAKKEKEKMKGNKRKKLPVLIASALLSVSICFVPATAEAQTARNQYLAKTVAEKEITMQIAAESARTFKRSVSSQGKSSTVVVNVPAASGGKALAGAQFKSGMGKTVDRKTGSFSATPVTGGKKTTVIPSSSRVIANTSKGRGSSVPAVKTEEQSTKSNSGGSLCLVALGLQLNPDGSMQQELIGRLEMLVIAAKKNPDAIIVCTGGHSAVNNRAVSEGGQMAAWLRKKGIDSDRILVESNAMTTQDNAVYTLKLLNRYHPEVSRIAIITSDYHMDDGVQLFTAQANRMGSRITVTPGKAWKAR